MPMAIQTDSLDDLPFYFARLFHVYRGSIQRRLGGSKLGEHIRPGMGSIYLALCAEDDCHVKRLAERLAMPGPTLTYLLDQLEKSGIVERRDCPDDGRAYRVRLTTFGRSLEPEIRTRHKVAITMMQRGLSEEETATLKRLLQRVLANFQADERQWRMVRKPESAKMRAERSGREGGSLLGRKRPTLSK
jgi:DNA-binding MarR family transcriptional regulator